MPETTDDVPGYRNCHAIGVASVVMARYADGRPRLRMFVAEPHHELWRNLPGRGPMSVGFHSHRADISLVRIHGQPMQCEARVSGIGPPPEVIQRWKWDRLLLGGTRRFVPSGTARIHRLSPFVFETVRMTIRDLHTVAVRRGHAAAWMVVEGCVTGTEEAWTLSDADLSAWSLAGMYQPMTAREAAEVVGEAWSVAAREVTR